MKQIFTAIMACCSLFAFSAAAQLEAPSMLKKTPKVSTRTGVEDVIWGAEGTTKSYTKTYSGCYAYMDIEWVENIETPSQIIWGDNNDVYFPDIISMMPLGTYTKGTVEGDKITLSLPQTLYLEEEEYKGEIYQTLYNLNLLMPFEDGGFKTYFPIEEASEVTFTIAEDGTITLDPIENDFMLGLSVDDGS